MNMLHTIRTNWRDILVAIVLVFGFAYAADVVAQLSVEGKDVPGSAQLVASMQGFSNFFAANLCAWLGIAVAWPTLNKFSNNSFTDAWQNHLTTTHRFAVLIVVACAWFIGACLCFSS